jgi:hypothetical protein
MQAFMIFADKSISNRDLLSGKVVLWNVIIGEGDANGKPSKSTLVVVSTTNKASSSSHLKLFARNQKNKTIFSSTQIVSTKSQRFEFVIPNTGCEPLDLTAELGTEKKSGKINFECGE